MKLLKPYRLFLTLILALGLFVPATASAAADRVTAARIPIASVNWNH